MARFVIAVFLSFLLYPFLGVLAAPDIASVTPTGPGASDPEATPTATIRFSVQQPQITTCQYLNITWTVDSDTPSVDIAPMSIRYSNFNVTQTTYSPSPKDESIIILPVSRRGDSWLVFETEPGNYVITATPPQIDPQPVIVASDPFVLQPGDASCLNPNATSTMTNIPLSSDASTPSQTTSTSPPATSHKSNAAAIAGGTIAGLVVLAGLVIFCLLRRRRNNKVANNLSGFNAAQKAGAGKGHRKWGGLSSIDKLQQGEIPVVIPANSPYASPTYRNRSQSTGHVLTDEEGMEKGYSKDAFPVDADLLSEMPTLDSNRNTRRYSSDALSNVIKQGGGLATYNEEHTRYESPSVAAPVLTTTHATFKGGDDPFSDAAFITRAGKRSSALSVPSTARAPSRLSDTSTRPTPSPIPTPTTSAPPSQNNTMVRNTSATASVGRPQRKPVPQYTDDSFELTNTSKSSPTSHSPLSSRPNRGNSNSDTSPTTLSRNNSTSPTESSSYWHHDRAPIANRNIGLANQGDGPVHYLMPDLPPSAQ